MSGRATSAAWLRVGLLATLLVMAAALLAASWSAWSGVRGASDALVAGQADALLQSLRRSLREARELPDAEALASFLDEEREAGLRHVAVYRRDGSVFAEAGDRTGAPFSPEAAFEPGELVVERIGNLVRVAAPLPGRRGRELRPPRRDRSPEWRPERGPDGRRPEGRRRGRGPEPPPPGREPGREPGPEPGPALVLEFEPQQADALEAQATRAFGVGALVAAALAVAAVVLTQLLRQRERVDRELAERRRLSALGEMSAVLAHEIRNPLASLKGHAQLLAERLPEEGRERSRADRIVTEARRLEQLASRLLDFVRAGRVEPEPTDPVALVQGCVDALGTAAEVRVLAGKAPSTWSLDPIRFREVVTNLLENAVEASPSEATVTVRVATEDGRLVVEVRDRGDGLEPGEEARIFEPFHTTRTKGTGLGLAVARRVVELHGGTIVARDAPGGGATFRVELPR